MLPWTPAFARVTTPQDDLAATFANLRNVVLANGDHPGYEKTSGHMAGRGKARLGNSAAAIGGPPGATRREAAARRQTA
jgi:hypothetical protein